MSLLEHEKPQCRQFENIIVSQQEVRVHKFSLQRKKTTKHKACSLVSSHLWTFLKENETKSPVVLIHNQLLP